MWFNRNRRLILSFLFILILIRICTPSPRELEKAEPVKPRFEEPSSPNELKSYEQLEYEQIQKIKDQPSLVLPTYLLMVALVLIVFLFQRKNILKYLMPQRVRFGARIFRAGGVLLVKISIENKTRNTIEFEQPVIVFSSIMKNRRFKLTSGDFPLMLAPDTSHSITFSPEKIISTQPEIKKMPFAAFEVVASNGKKYRTLPRLIRFQ